MAARCGFGETAESLIKTFSRDAGVIRQSSRICRRISKALLDAILKGLSNREAA